MATYCPFEKHVRGWHIVYGEIVSRDGTIRQMTRLDPNGNVETYADKRSAELQVEYMRQVNNLNYSNPKEKGRTVYWEIYFGNQLRERI